MIFLINKPDIVQIKMDHAEMKPSKASVTRALQIKVGSNRTVIIYNRINNYILDAVLKAVFTNDHQ